MWIQCETGAIIRSEEVKEFGITWITLERGEGDTFNTYSLYAFGVGSEERLGNYCNRHRYLIQYADRDVCLHVLEKLFQALDEGDKTFNVSFAKHAYEKAVNGKTPFEKECDAFSKKQSYLR